MYKKFIYLTLMIGLLLAACGPVSTPNETQQPTDAIADPVSIRIAVLPLIDTLPMYVAEQEGMFRAFDLNVEFIPRKGAYA